MNQIKYILSACLILLTVFMGVFLFKTFPGSGIVAQDQTTIDVDAPTPVTVTSEGERLFKQNCSSCHAIDKEITGPALGGVETRGPWTNRKNVVRWVNGPASFMRNDKYTQGLKMKYGVMMTTFNLSEKEVYEILDYINNPPATRPIY